MIVTLVKERIVQSSVDSCFDISAGSLVLNLQIANWYEKAQRNATAGHRDLIEDHGFERSRLENEGHSIEFGDQP